MAKRRTEHTDVPPLHAAIYRVIARIPEGTVATYGQIAEMVDTGPRQVGRALRETPKGVNVPWHRVVNSRGESSVRAHSDAAHQRQVRKLEAEGVEFRNGRIDLEVYRWNP